MRLRPYLKQAFPYRCFLKKGLLVLNLSCNKYVACPLKQQHLKRRMYSLFTLVLFLFLSGGGSGGTPEAAHTIAYTDSTKTVKIGNQVQLYHDETGQLNLQQAENLARRGNFSLSRFLEPNFGPTTDAIWLTGRIQNQSTAPLYLELDNEVIDEVDFYTRDSLGTPIHYRTGDTQIFSRRPVEDRSFVFPLPKGKAPVEFFIRIKGNNPLSAPLIIGTRRLLQKRSNNEDYGLFLYLGVLIAVISELMYLFFSGGRRQYFFYILYICTKSWFLFSLKGYTFAYLFPDDPQLTNLLTTLSITACVYFGAGFAAHFLNTKARLPHLHRRLQLVPVACGAALLCLFTGQIIWAVYIVGAAVLFAGTYSMYLAYVSNRNGFKPARFFLLAFSMPIVVNLLNIGGTLGWFPNYVWYGNLIIFSSALEMILLTFALADKINSFSRQKNVMQQQTIQALEANEALVREQNGMLEERVRERTQELEKVHRKLEDAYRDLTLKNDDVKSFIENLNNSNEELNTAMEQLQLQNRVIASKNKDIMDSLNYAKKIQSVILPSRKKMSDGLGSYFVFYRPKTIVSGDFYWFEKVGDKSVLCVVDCTGHGVPGAFMSIIAYSALIKIVKDDRISDPATILEHLERSVVTSLNQYDQEDGLQDGMEIGICTIDYKNNMLQYAGAKRSLLALSNNKGLVEYRPTKTSIGMNFGAEGLNKHFESHTIPLHPGDKLYMFTDGYIDQFGGSGAKKFSRNRFKELIEEIGSAPIAEQRHLLEDRFENWRGSNEQVDDILVLGVEI